MDRKRERLKNEPHFEEKVKYRLSEPKTGVYALLSRFSHKIYILQNILISNMGNNTAKWLLAGTLSLASLVAVGCDRRDDTRFNSSQIERLEKAGIDEKVANEFDERFKPFFVVRMAESGLSPKVANEYNEKFNSSTVIALWKAHVMPEDVDQYDARFTSLRGIAGLARNGITPEVANQYDKRFFAKDVKTLQRFSIPADIANLFNEKLDAREIVLLNRLNINSSTANQFYEALDAHTTEEFRYITVLNKMGITPEQFTSYDSSLIDNSDPDISQFLDIAILIKERIEPDHANEFAKLNKLYDCKISGRDIFFFNKKGIGYEKVAEHARTATIDELRN